MRLNRRTRIAVVITCLVLILLSEWIMWEAVVKPLKDMNPKSWSRDFPAPFYIFYMPVWLWHDLSITLVIICSAVLSYLALRGGNKNAHMC